LTNNAAATTGKMRLFGSGGLSVNSTTDPGAGVINANTGFQVGGAAAAGKILIGNGANFVSSTPTFPTSSATALKHLRSDGTNWIVSTATYSDTPGTAGKLMQSDGTNWITSTATWPTNVTAGYDVLANGTNYVAYPADLFASSVTSVSSAYAADTYLAGSTITVAAGDFKAQGQYTCKFDMTKTGAGTATPIITLRMGTAGTTSDPAIATITFGAGTGVVDTGVFEVSCTFRTVGSGTSAVVQCAGECRHSLAAAGLTSTGAGSDALILVTSAGFASTTQTKIGLSFNGGSAFSGTNTLVQAALKQP
jgi:hypothetical protein